MRDYAASAISAMDEVSLLGPRASGAPGADGILVLFRCFVRPPVVWQHSES